MRKAMRLIAGNMGAGPVTVRLPESVPAPPGYRGLVVLDPARCLACHTCAYVCVSFAITGTEAHASYAWDYEPSRCTFCARCVDHCPGSALSMSPLPPPAYTRKDELAARHLVPFAACLDCGQPVRPATPELLAMGFEHVTDDTRMLLRCCERCRRKRLQRRMLPSNVEPIPEGKP